MGDSWNKIAYSGSQKHSNVANDEELDQIEGNKIKWVPCAPPHLVIKFQYYLDLFNNILETDSTTNQQESLDNVKLAAHVLTAYRPKTSNENEGYVTSTIAAQQLYKRTVFKLILHAEYSSVIDLFEEIHNKDFMINDAMTSYGVLLALSEVDDSFKGHRVGKVIDVINALIRRYDPHPDSIFNISDFKGLEGCIDLIVVAFIDKIYETDNLKDIKRNIMNNRPMDVKDCVKILHELSQLYSEKLEVMK